MFLFSHNFHCYVILYDASEKRGIIADGRNTFIEDATVQQELKALLKFDLIAISYDQQFREDQCATSAVMIALELMRAYKQGKDRLPASLTTSKVLRNRVSKHFHKFF